jgi:type VI secretion system protein ImpL
MLGFGANLPTSETYLDRQLVEAGQRSLSRMDLADLALALIKAASYSADLQDLAISSRTGPQSAIVFDTSNGSSLASMRIPGLYTKAGYDTFFLRQLGTIARRIVDDQWVMGAGGQQVGIEAQLKQLGPSLLAKYSADFIAAWTAVLDNLKLRPMTEDKPQYAALRAVGSESSPLRQLVETVAGETSLGQDEGDAAMTDADAAAQAEGWERIGIAAPSGKAQSRAGGAFGEIDSSPGATIEAQFRPFRNLVTGSPGQRPIDSIVRNFHDIYQSLILTAAGDAGVGGSLQMQVYNLRANASRLPKPLTRMLEAAAGDFEGDVVESSIAQMSQEFAERITGPCSALVEGAYPFVKASAIDASPADFARLFAPDGEMDRFFAQNIATLADIGSKPWRWKQDSRLARGLSTATLQAFQNAAEIRDAFFGEGRSSLQVGVSVTPVSLHAEADLALLNIDGQVIQAHHSGDTATTVNWPGEMSSGSAELSLLPDIPGRASVIRFQGPWALLRLMDTATVSSNAASGVDAHFVIGGRDVGFKIQVNTKENPFASRALTEFACPDRL